MKGVIEAKDKGRPLVVFKKLDDADTVLFFRDLVCGYHPTGPIGIHIRPLRSCSPCFTSIGGHLSAC